MNVLVYAPYAINTPHFETALELIQRHLDAGDRVTLAVCNADLLACDANWTHDAPACWECIGKRSAGLAMLSARVPVIPMMRLTEGNREELRGLDRPFTTVAELKQLKLENFDLGFGVLSSIISQIRDPDPDLVKHQDAVRRFLLSAVAVYRSLQNLLDAEPYQRVYAFNGRYAPMRAALRACQSREVPCFIHEVGSTIQHYALFENTTPHDLSYIHQRISETWEDSKSNPNLEATGEKFFLDRAKGIAHTWFSFITDQTPGQLPENWNHSRKNIVIFNSSEDEFAAIGDSWKHPLYATQLDGLIQIADSLAADSEGLHIYLRIHPNLKGVDNEQTRRLADLRRPFLTVIPPESPVSTYTLLKHAEKVISFGSTVGIEATFWGRPSILLGQCFYRQLGGTYNPQSHEELLQLLRADLKPCPKEAALKYGFYQLTFGTPFRYFKAKSVFEGEFKGKRLEPSRWLWKVVWALKKFPFLHRWANQVSFHLANHRLTGRCAA